MTNEEYNVNFFKPLSDHAKANKKLIATLASIWFVAVFGFQALLLILEEPVPEKAYEDYLSVWPAVTTEAGPSFGDAQTFSRSLLFVLGKNIAVKDNHKAVVKNALSWSVYSMLSDSLKPAMKREMNDETILLAKNVIGLKMEGFDKLMTDLLPSSLVKVNSENLSAEIKSELPGIMKLYLVHNRSALTDFTFIGFPFHYWYSAQFLLILFVVLCLIYAVLIEKSNKEHNFIEE